jgi:type IV secretion system protein TrbI
MPDSIFPPNQAQPSSTPPVQLRKPFGWKTLVVIAASGVLVVIFVLAFATAIFHAIPDTSKRKPEATQPATSEQFSSFKNTTDRQAKDFAEHPPTEKGLDDMANGGVADGTQEQRDAQKRFDATGKDRQTGSGNGGQITPAQQAALDAKARRLEALRASSIVTTAGDTTSQPSAPQTQTTANPLDPAQQAVLDAMTRKRIEQETQRDVVAALTSGETQSPAPQTDQAARQAASPATTKVDYPWNSSTGQTYRLMAGTILESVTVNRLDGEFTGPVAVMLTNNTYSRNWQQMLMPAGTKVLGEAARVGGTEQSRLAITFHRIIMPDGYSVSLDKDPGLDQQGATGLKDKISHHYFKIFGTSIAIGGLAGLAQIGNNGATIGLGGIREGITSQTAQEATQILDRMLNIMPTITIREGRRCRIWLAEDITLPAYGNHTVSPTL